MGLSAEALVFYRLVIAAGSIGVAAVALRRLGLLRAQSSRPSLVLIGVLLAGHWFLFFETIKLSSVAVALLTVYTAPILLALVAPIFLPERRSPVALAALLPAGGGLALIALTGGDDAHARPLAIATGLGGALTYAVLVIATKRLSSRLPVITITFWIYGLAGAALAPFLWIGGRVLPHGAEIGYVFLLGAVFTALSGFTYVTLLRHVTAQAVGILAYLEVVSSAVLAWAILDQALGWPVAAGGALVIAGGIGVVLLEPADAAAIEAATVRLPGDAAA